MTTKTRKTAKQQARSATLMTLSDGKLILWLTIGDDLQAYGLTPMASDFGSAFHLQKADRGDGRRGEYDVLLHGGESSCTCQGNTYRGHCKHVEALLALVKSGKLSAPVAMPEPQPEREPGIDDEIMELTEEPPAPRQPWCRYCNDDPNKYCSYCSL